MCKARIFISFLQNRFKIHPKFTQSIIKKREFNLISNEGQHLYAKGERNSKIEKYIDSFKQFFLKSTIKPSCIITHFRREKNYIFREYTRNFRKITRNFRELTRNFREITRKFRVNARNCWYKSVLSKNFYIFYPEPRQNSSKI